jgi:hypothetical protein
MTMTIPALWHHRRTMPVRMKMRLRIHQKQCCAVTKANCLLCVVHGSRPCFLLFLLPEPVHELHLGQTDSQPDTSTKPCLEVRAAPMQSTIIGLLQPHGHASSLYYNLTELLPQSTAMQCATLPVVCTHRVLISPMKQPAVNADIPASSGTLPQR